MPIIGREPPAEIVIAAPQVSARHAEIRPLGGGKYELIDLGSTNGTFVNGQRIQRAVISLGDHVGLGSLSVNLTAYQHLLAGPAAPVAASGPAAHAYGAAPAPPPLSPPGGPPGPPRPPVGPPSVGGMARPSAPLPVPPREPSYGAPSRATGSSLNPALIAGVGLALVLLVVGVLFATRATITRSCQLCTTRIFEAKAFVWAERDVNAEADRRVAENPWCTVHANELVTVHHVERCKYCKKPIREWDEQAPRIERRADTDEEKGYCGDQCQYMDMAAAAGRGVRDMVGGAAEGISNFAGDMLNAFKRR